MRSCCIVQGTISLVMEHDGGQCEKKNICITGSLRCTVKIDRTL